LYCSISCLFVHQAQLAIPHHSFIAHIPQRPQTKEIYLLIITSIAIATPQPMKPEYQTSALPSPPIERAAYQPSILRQPRIPCNEEAGTNSPQTATCMIRHLILRKLTRILPHPSPRRSQGTMRSDRGLKRPGCCHTDRDPARYKRGWERACQVFGCDLLECDEARVG